MFNTAVLAFFFFMLLICTERMVNKYNSSYNPYAAILPWLVLFMVVIFIMTRVDITTIAINAQHEISAAWKELTWNLSQAF